MSRVTPITASARPNSHKEAVDRLDSRALPSLLDQAGAWFVEANHPLCIGIRHWDEPVDWSGS